MKTAGLRHVALNVVELEACCDFYQQAFGMEIEWQPDADNIYLTSGNDNLALHRGEAVSNEGQRLDHIGFIIDEIDAVDDWYVHIKKLGGRIVNEPKTHRDGARSFYCEDPAGNVVQVIYHPPISRGTASA
ncbi:MAG: VOC family protein [Pseudomonadaceae bacterium]|nr:VOC family protein [Pseudomonadaceae bacterium]